MFVTLVVYGHDSYEAFIDMGCVSAFTARKGHSEITGRMLCDCTVCFKLNTPIPGVLNVTLNFLLLAFKLATTLLVASETNW